MKPSLPATWMCLLAAAALAGCTLMIRGVSNSNLFVELPPGGTFTIQLFNGDPVVGNKIERMLRHQIEKHGYLFGESAPDLLVTYAFDVVPAGSVSTAYTFITMAPQTAFISGNTITLNPTHSTAATVVGTTRLFNKTIAVRISRASTGQKL